jgi:hypothetical protein
MKLPVVQSTIAAHYARALILHIDRRDSDGRPVGLCYDRIRDLVLAAFPCVITKGVHHGKPMRLSYKDLQNMTCILNESGTRCPFRPRRKSDPPKTVISAKNRRQRAWRAANVKRGLTSLGAIRVRPRAMTVIERRRYLRNYGRIRRRRNLDAGLRSDGRPRVRRAGRKHRQ